MQLLSNFSHPTTNQNRHHYIPTQKHCCSISQRFFCCNLCVAGRAVPLARLAAFKQRLLPRLRRGLDERVLIYVPDYYDLEELRALLHNESLSFCYVHEYVHRFLCIVKKCEK